MAIKQGKADLSRFGVDGRHLKVTRGTRRVDLSKTPPGTVIDLSKPDHDSSTHPDLLNKPGKTNWVEEQGGLPSFIKRVAKHIVTDGGLSESHAIAAAVQQCRDGKFGAKGLAAYAEFRAKAAAARAT
jgi:hypothetical protein